MPFSINDMFDLPRPTPRIQVALEPARSMIHSLMLLSRGHQMAGISDWVADTQAAMTPEERKTNDLVLLGLYYAVLPMETWNTFPAYVDHLASMPPENLRDKLLDAYEQTAHNPEYKGQMFDLGFALQSPENYIAYLQQRFEPKNVDEEVEQEAYRYVMDPPAMQRLVVRHLRHMWDRYLSEEWERVRPTLQAIVRAYRRTDFDGKSLLEVGRLISGQELDEQKWSPFFSEASRAIFIPHPHVGPYVPRCRSKKGEVVVFFNTRLPDGMAKDTPDLTRTEITIRLSALADDTRLRILRHLAETGEQRSQAIMDALELSQSAASRHLTQLSAAGFLNERRCEGAKCYAINPERVTDTLQAIASFLLAQERNEA
jgi:DNA-binding transcriptional ArsR family regulator